MGQRVALGKSLTSASTASASTRVRIQDPPYLFSTSSGWTGTIAIQHSDDGPDVSDAAADWRTIITLNVSDQASWRDPLYRIRINPAVLTGSANVYMIEYVRALRAYPARDNDTPPPGEHI
jgi:hypothetical protein